MKPLHERVSIRFVELFGLEVRSELDPRALPERPPVLTIDAQARGELVAPGVIGAKVNYGITGAAAVDGKHVLEIHAAYRLTFSLNDDDGAREDEIDRLAHVSGVFMSWPYLRELVASLYCRMDLPLPLLPSLAPSVAAMMPWHLGAGTDPVPSSRGSRRIAAKR